MTDIVPRPKAILVAIQLPEIDDKTFSSSLDELRRLVKTLGYDVVEKVTQARDNLSPSAVLGEGKLKLLAELTGGSGTTGFIVPRKTTKARARWEIDVEEEIESAPDSDEPDALAIDLVAVDHDLTPSQARNLERATGVQVLDRTGIIIEIFHRHAKSREARLQVEIARLTYSAPRLRESPSGKERQQGRGAGESALELDRRKIRDRIAELREELAAVQKEQIQRRQQRKDQRRVALVGYTNAGKSSLMRALTESEVYVEDKLFATLDTTIRALQPEVKPRILVSDTVGFIKKLPHDLVASFKSTLDEALEASHLLHLVDASDPDWENQYSVTRQVLEEIGAQKVSNSLVMNKIDRVPPEQVAELKGRFPDAWFICAHDKGDVATVRDRIIGVFDAQSEEAEILVPYSQSALVSEMHEIGKVLDQSYGEAGVVVRVRAAPAEIARIRSKVSTS